MINRLNQSDDPYLRQVGSSDNLPKSDALEISKKEKGRSHRYTKLAINEFKNLESQASDVEVIKEYLGLVNALNSVPGLKRHMEKFSFAKKTIAFLVEELKNTQPKFWQEGLKSIKDRIKNSKNDPFEEEIEVSWMLNKMISQLFAMRLETKIEELSKRNKPEELAYYHRAHQILEESHKFNLQLHICKHPTNFGVVINEFVPKWYINNFSI